MKFRFGLLLASLLALWPSAVRAQVLPPSPGGIVAASSASTDCVFNSNCFAATVPTTAGALTFSVTGTATSLTLTFEGCTFACNVGANFFSINVTKLSTGVQATTTTSTGQYAFSNTGLLQVRVRCTTYVSGGVNITLTRGSEGASVMKAIPSFGSFTTGDLLYASATNVISGLAVGSAGKIVRSNGTLPVYSTATFADTYSAGDVIVASGANAVAGTACAAGTVLAGGSPAACTANPSVTTATVTRTGIATTSTDGFIATNTTAATSGATVQMSPRVRLRGNAWDTAASQTVDFFMENLPATAATPTGTWRLGYSLNGAGAVFPLLVTSAGGITGLSGGFILSGGSVFSAAASGFIHNGRTSLSAPTDGTENITNNANSSGFGFDGNTDGTMKVRVRAQNAYATVDALAYNASGTPITSGTTHLSAGSGMAVANVGANSCGTSAASIAGNNNAFVITVGATSGTQCRVAFTISAATEWDCAANDNTTTVAVRTTPVDATHTDLIGTFTAGDKVTGICFPR